MMPFASARTYDPWQVFRSPQYYRIAYEIFLQHLKLVEVNHKKLIFDTISVEFCVLGRSKEYQK